MKDKQQEEARELFKKEVRSIIEEFFRDGHLQGNKINIADFEVFSTTSSLKDVEETLNRLVHKYKDFAGLRKRRVIAEAGGYFG